MLRNGPCWWLSVCVLYYAGASPGASMGGVPLSASGLISAPVTVLDDLPLDPSAGATSAFWAPVVSACADHLMRVAPRVVVEEQTQWPLVCAAPGTPPDAAEVEVRAVSLTL